MVNRPPYDRPPPPPPGGFDPRFGNGRPSGGGRPNDPYWERNGPVGGRHPAGPYPAGPFDPPAGPRALPPPRGAAAARSAPGIPRIPIKPPRSTLARRRPLRRRTEQVFREVRRC